MNKIKVLTWICLLVLLFSGCAENSENQKESTPTPIEEEQRIQDAPALVLADGEREEAKKPMETALGYYYEENRLNLRFSAAEIFDGEAVVGRYINKIAYFELQAVMDRLGWDWIVEDTLVIGKGDLQYQFREGLVHLILFDERGSPYELQFPLREIEGTTMIAQYDLEILFGLQSWWDPKTRMLTQVEWGWEMPENLGARAFGDQISATMAYEAREKTEWVLDWMPSIDLKDAEFPSLHGRRSGHSEGNVLQTETRKEMLVPGETWTGNAWVSYRARPIAMYALHLAFAAESGKIEISQGPWVEFTLESPTAFYTRNADGISIDGTTEDSSVEVVLSALEEGVFVSYFQTQLPGDGPFSFEHKPETSGIYRIDIWTEKNEIRQNRTHFYYEKES